MTIREVEKAQMNRALAYAIGLMYPLYKEKNVKGVDYVLGCVNHNANMITDEDLAKHFKSVMELFMQFDNSKGISVKDNKANKIQPKIGFSVLFEQNGLDESQCINILTKKVIEIKDCDLTIKQEFVKGCFDGRSSWDKTAHYLSIDVDRDYERQNLIVDICKSCGIILNVNNRGEGHPKNDQLRIKPDCLHTFLYQIGMYSTYRYKLVDNWLRMN